MRAEGLNMTSGTSPAKAGDMGSTPVSRKIPHAMEQRKPRATTAEPVLWSLEATTSEDPGP